MLLQCLCPGAAMDFEVWRLLELDDVYACLPLGGHAEASSPATWRGADHADIRRERCWWRGTTQLGSLPPHRMPTSVLRRVGVMFLASHLIQQESLQRAGRTGKIRNNASSCLSLTKC